MLTDALIETFDRIYAINHDELQAQLLDVLVRFEDHYGMPILEAT